jgi:hypothetical protein
MSSNNEKTCARCGVGIDSDGDGNCFFCYALPDYAVLFLKKLSSRMQNAEALLKSIIPTIGLGTLWISKDWDGISEMKPATQEQMDRLDITRDENGIIVSVKVKSLCGNCGSCLDCLRMERSQ